jgi:hypothetical protein
METSNDNVTPIRYKPGVGLTVSGARFPKSIEEKVVVAKSIVQAALAAYGSGNLDDANYDIRWPLDMAIELLEQAALLSGAALLFTTSSVSRALLPNPLVDLLPVHFHVFWRIDSDTNLSASHAENSHRDV